MRKRYEEKILRVQLFIQSHLDENLGLDRLAEAAGYSPCHFHRIFRGLVGESTDEYVRRLRLERAAQSLRYRDQTVLAIALDAGYASHEAFTRAFTRFFGVTPSAYQTLEFPPPPLQEKIMQAVAYTAQNVQITRQPARRMAFLRVVGPYNNEALGPVFGRAYELGSAQGAVDEQSLGIGVYHDDPEVTAPDKQRADVGFTVRESFEPSGELRVQVLPPAKCAVLRHQGHYNTLGDAYRWLYGVWLPHSGYEPAAAPTYELYVNECSKLPPEEWLTDICLPLAE